MFLKTRSASSTDSYSRLRLALESADAVVIGAGAGLSTSAGFTYSGARFEENFADFIEKYDFEDMYSGGFYSFPTPEEHWAYWSRYIWVNRYMSAPKPVYERLFELVRGKDYFVLTTNVDHCFQKAGFAKHRLFYTQGDYGLWQCSEPCHAKTYDNADAVKRMIYAQGWDIAPDGRLLPPKAGRPLMRVPSELVPQCPVCGRPMSMNLRADSTFVQDEGWYAAAERYEDFLRRHEGSAVLYLELGVGYNTPAIIKYPFWRQTLQTPKATYACLNCGQAFAPREIEERAICIDGDIGETIELIRN